MIFLELPVTEYIDYFAPDYRLDVPSTNMEDLNTPQYLHNLKRVIFESLRLKNFAPSVQMQGMFFFFLEKN